MDFFEAVEKRRTVRDFEKGAIPQEDIVKIIDAALKAPTNDHMRDWHYILVRDRAAVLRLLEIVPRTISDEDMEQLLRDWDLRDSVQQNSYRIAVPKQYRMLADASVLVAPLMKLKTDLLHPDNISHLNGFASIWCSIENIFLAATALGYGCSMRIPLGDEEQWAKDVLGFPDDYFMPCFIGIGIPKKDVPGIEQKAIDIRERIHWDKW